jgi:hypothetical protein
VALMSAPAVSVPLTGTDQVVRDVPAYYVGFTIRETAGATAVVRIFDHASAATGTVLEEISLTANQSAREYYPSGLRAALGVYVDVVSGSVAGSVRIA